MLPSIGITPSLQATQVCVSAYRDKETINAWNTSFLEQPKRCIWIFLEKDQGFFLILFPPSYFYCLLFCYDALTEHRNGASIFGFPFLMVSSWLLTLVWIYLVIVHSNYTMESCCLQNSNCVCIFLLISILCQQASTGLNKIQWTCILLPLLQVWPLRVALF
mgnify:CR=1 FL=1